MSGITAHDLVLLQLKSDHEALDTDYLAHKANVSNPHAVTAAQAGAPTLAALAATDAAHAAHLADTNNPHSVDYSDVSDRYFATWSLTPNNVTTEQQIGTLAIGDVGADELVKVYLSIVYNHDSTSSSEDQLDIIIDTQNLLLLFDGNEKLIDTFNVRAAGDAFDHWTMAGVTQPAIGGATSVVLRVAFQAAGGIVTIGSDSITAHLTAIKLKI